MHLSNIKIENFRNLKSLVVDLRRGLNVLVGPNNAGKTNLFDAIRHALGSSSNQSESLWLEEEDIYHTSEGQPTTEPISIQLTFSDLNETQRPHFFEIIDFSQNVPTETACARINFEGSWLQEKGRFRVKRWGGANSGERTQIPTEILEALPVTFLPALRDAEAALTPGNRSVLARVLRDLSKRGGDDYYQDFETIFEKANEQLKDQPLIQTVEGRLRNSMQEMAGAGYPEPLIRAADPAFGRIVRTLRVILDKAPVGNLSKSGLGFNNLLFIGTVLAYLEEPREEECPILLVEEPESHLSPQHTVLLGEQLSQLQIPQVLVSTHSPTFAAQARPSQMLMLHERQGLQRCHPLHKTGMTTGEERQLQRMLDITRATLYFAKGVILVEGISEALLLPELARISGIDLAKNYISVVPISGVSFGTFEKLFGAGGLEIPVSILTDADPAVFPGDTKDWKSESPNIGQKCDRLVVLEAAFSNVPTVDVRNSIVTLEYDLALAGDGNPKIMARAWVKTFTGTPGFTEASLEGLNTKEEKALAVWRGICRAKHSGSKADFAHMLAEELAEMRLKKDFSFSVPDYICQAIKHAQSATASQPAEE